MFKRFENMMDDSPFADAYVMRVELVNANKHRSQHLKDTAGEMMLGCLSKITEPVFFQDMPSWRKEYPDNPVHRSRWIRKWWADGSLREWCELQEKYVTYVEHMRAVLQKEHGLEAAAIKIRRHREHILGLVKEGNWEVLNEPFSMEQTRGEALQKALANLHRTLGAAVQTVAVNKEQADAMPGCSTVRSRLPTQAAGEPPATDHTAALSSQGAAAEGENLVAVIQAAIQEEQRGGTSEGGGAASVEGGTVDDTPMTRRVRRVVQEEVVPAIRLFMGQQIAVSLDLTTVVEELSHTSSAGLELARKLLATSSGAQPRPLQQATASGEQKQQHMSLSGRGNPAAQRAKRTALLAAPCPSAATQAAIAANAAGKASEPQADQLILLADAVNHVEEQSALLGDDGSSDGHLTGLQQTSKLGIADSTVIQCKTLEGKGGSTRAVVKSVTVPFALRPEWPLVKCVTGRSLRCSG